MTVEARGPAGERREALARFEAGHYAEAAARLVTLLARVPPDPVLLRCCGLALVRTGEAARGLPFLARARRMAPADAVSALWHGIGLQRADQLDEAANAFRDAARLDPAHPAALVHLGHCLLRLRQPTGAAQAADAAEGRAPGLPEAAHLRCLADLAALRATPGIPATALAAGWAALGRSAYRLDAVAEAHQALTEATSLDPEAIAPAVDLALIEHLRGQPIAAIARLRACLARDPSHAAARLALAGRLLMAGNAAAALSLLDGPHPAGDMLPQWQAERARALLRLHRPAEARAALDLTRGHPPGRAALPLSIQARRLALAEGEAVAAEQLAGRIAALADNREAGTLEHRVDAHFELGELRHRQQRHRDAFGHWRRGHALLQPAQPFSRDIHAAITDATIESWTADRLRTGPRSRDTTPGAVFIVGLPRTGTTLLEQILHCHPAVHGAGERLAVRETLANLTGTSEPSDAIRRASALDADRLTAAGHAFLAEMREISRNTPLILDKMPDNAAWLGFIAALLPGARVIWCRRDLRDVGASIFCRRFLGEHAYAHDLAHLGWFMRQHERLMRHWREALPVPMLELEHGDWIRNANGTLDRVLEFLQLPFDAACTRFFEHERDVETASRDQVRRPINADGVGRWRPYAEHLEPMLAELVR